MVKDRNYICFGSSGQLFYMKYSVLTQTFGRWFTGSNHLTLSCSCTHRSACVPIHWVCGGTSVVICSVIRTVISICAYTYIVPWGDFSVVMLCIAYVFTLCDIPDTFDPHCSCLNNYSWTWWISVATFTCFCLGCRPPVVYISDAGQAVDCFHVCSRVCAIWTSFPDLVLGSGNETIVIHAH